MGGGVYVWGTNPSSGPQIVNNTICGNSATSGSGLYSSGAYPVVLNSILWNEGSNIYQIGGLVTAQYCDVRGGWAGTGNIDANPAFLDTTYRLSNSSPCIGAGIDSVQIGGTWYYAPPLCFFGGPRPNPAGSHPDIGACENPRGTPTGVEEQPSSLPLRFALEQNYPNPFNPSTSFEFKVPSSKVVTLEVYDVLGRAVATLVNEVKHPGTYTVQWDATSRASGVYFYRLSAPNFVQTRKLLILK